MSGKTARAVALDTLVAYETGGVWSARRFSQSVRAAGLDRRDAAFCSHLAGGVVQNRILLDYCIAKLSKIPLKKLETRVLCLLRLGAFQIIFSDGVHDAAAVSETVSLARDARTRGFVNAVLRALARVENPLNIDIAPLAERLSVRYSMPLWIVNELIEAAGDRAESELAAMNEPPPVTIHANTSRVSAERLSELLSERGASVAPGKAGHTLDVRGAGDIEHLAEFQNGLFWVQDAAAVMAVRALGVSDGDSVLDLCASPGGKSFAALSCASEAKLTACDLSAAKVDIIHESAKRLGFTLNLVQNDATKFRPRWQAAFDKVICDVPCSGLGIIRKKPDIRYKDRSSIEALPALQAGILLNAARYVKPGGKLLYSTCTWRGAENEAVVQKLLDGNPEFSVYGDARTLWTSSDGTDGFFICVLEKNHV